MRARIRSYLENNLWVQRVKKVSIPGFQGVPLYEVAVFFYGELQKEAITIRAGALAYSFFLALFPALIFLFTLIPYVPVDNLDAIVLQALGKMMPDSAFLTVRDTVADIVGKQRGGLLSFGLLLALYFAMNGVITMMKAFKKHYSVYIKRGFFRQQLVALNITLGFSVLVIVAVVLIVGGQWMAGLLFEFLDMPQNWMTMMLHLLRWVIILLLLQSAFAFLYFIGPPTRMRWQFFSPGATLATVLAVVTSLAFSYYVNNFGAYNKLYGSIGTIIVLMLWLYINSLVLLIGFELNASINLTRQRREKNETESS